MSVQMKMLPLYYLMSGGMSVLNKFASGLHDMERYAFNGASLF